MKKIQSEYVHTHITKKIYKVFFLTVLAFIVALKVPGGYQNVYAAPLEDCDLDGYDDATGVPVPWPGYDETKGDTPAGPGGDKTSTQVPDGSDNISKGNSNSDTPDKTSKGDSDKTNSKKSESTNSVNSGKSNNTKSQNTNKANSEKTNNVKSQKTNNSTNNKTGKVRSSKTSNKISNKKNSEAEDNTNKVESVDTSNTAKDNTRKTKSNVTSNMISNKGDSKAKDNTSSTKSNVGNSKEKASQSDNEQTKVNLEAKNTAKTSISADEIKTIVNTKGTLKITEANGSVIHAGSAVIIAGSGFTRDIHNLEIEIHSELRQLGSVESSKKGSFEAQLNIPEDLKPGVHHIVVLYQGKEITRQQIKVGPKAADSFLQALLVGFTKDNEGLIPGLSILIGLFVIGVGVLGVSAVIRSDKRKANAVNSLNRNI